MRDTPAPLVTVLGHGATAGLLATLPMSAVMWTAQRLGVMGRQPPERIVSRALAEAEVRPSGTVKDFLAVGSHAGYGAAMGAVYALLRPRLTLVPPVAGGVGFALLVWAGSYLGWLPALGLHPAADDDRPGRTAAMIVAHMVFGGVLGRLTR